MRKIWVLAIGLTLAFSGFFLPGSAQAQFKIAWKSIDCTKFVKGGTNLSDNEQAFVCGIALKEIATKCCNQPGCDVNEQNANSKNFKLNGVTLKWANADATIKTKNGTRPVDVTIENDDIITMVNEWNYDCLNGRGPSGCQVVDLSSNICPSANWTFVWAPSRVDILAMNVIRPIGGSNDFKPCTLRSYPATVDPRYATDPTGVDPDGDGWIFECIPNKDIFKDCRRSESGLTFYDAAQSIVPAGSKANIQDCLIYRDVNNDPTFSLAAVGTYDPDLAHLYAPFDGTTDKGGAWLTEFVLGANYTGTCHQHGREQVSGGKFPTVSWQQSGPKKPTYVNGKPDPTTGDPQCTGGSQLLDGIDYNTDGILP